MALKKTPLKQGSKPLQRKKSLQHMGKRTKRNAPKRRQVVKEVLERDGGKCMAANKLPEIRCGGDLDVHETLSRGRSGGTSALVPDLCISVCRVHHTFITQNPDIAEEKGLLIKWTKNPPKKSV